MVEYDLLYQKWLQAKRARTYAESDRLREEFERLHKLTIYTEGDMPVIGVTVQRMNPSTWETKYGNPAVGKIMRDWESQVGFAGLGEHL